MNLPEVIKDLPIQCEKNLAALYESVCDEYRRRLCEMWNLDIYDSWWVPSDRPGETLILSMCDYSISMEDARLFVDLNVSYESFMEWWDYNMEEYNHNRKTINAYSWFALGARPEILKDDGKHTKD